ncbi:MAG: type I-B CRISPR-associated protein Cas7/Cst2/DevR [Dehalococcoidia bacterium]|nr:type I-B CRISPR-associated protein Cas7/Cst2/DevR [Dehalococcoidia bacterium]
MKQEYKAISMAWLSRTGLTNLNSGEGGFNLIDVKKYKWERKEYPYVSGQAMRFYLKEAIRRKLDPGTREACVPDPQGEACGEPDKCILCDLFGFMHPRGAKIRLSPTKVSPAMGLKPLDGTLVTDFLTRRHRAEEAGRLEGDIVNVELSTNIYKVGICLDLLRVGREEAFETFAETPRLIRSLKFDDIIDEKERERRIGLLLDAVKEFSDYSKQARLLTDFTPDVIIACLQREYSHRLQKALELERDGLKLSIPRLDQVLREMIGEKFFAGILDGVLENTKEIHETLKKFKVEITTPREMIGKVKSEIGIV